MSFIGEALLSAAMTTLFGKLSSLSPDLLQFARQEQIHADLEEWKKILEKIQAVLDDAAEKQTEKNLVKIWLGELKKLAYDAEDILDEFATEALERKFLEEPQASTSKVIQLIPTCCTGLSPRSLKRNSAMASQIKEITTRLQMILKEKNDFDLKENWGTRPNQDRSQNQRDPKTSLNEPHIYGRDKDKEAIVLEVLKDEDTDAQFSVVSVYGMGGIGKTTLAQLVYNDASVKGHFDIKAWVYVSENFNVTQLTKTILQSIDQNTGDVNDLNMLQVKLKERLSGKKFFIVLDDVWNESYENWTELCLPFDGGSKGSKIMVTTRNRSVSLMVGAFVPYRLKELSTDDCLSVFTRHSLGKEDFSEHGCLEEIGKKIIGKCAGLPLAAKTLGGLLRGKPDCKQWEDVLESNFWNLPHEEKSGLVPALKVSYYYLPSHLKQCFAYCSILAKGRHFYKEDLILLWMSEGFLQANSRKQAEEFGEEYFDDLHSRSFFQQSESLYVSCFVIHDLINDLAQWVAKDFCFRIENLQEGEKEWKIPVNLRHLGFRIDRSNYKNIKESGVFNKMKSVRTFLGFSPFLWNRDDFSVVLRMVLQLQRLRVLSLKGYPIFELPNSIGDMKLLHHLDLSYTSIKCLPDSVNKLYNLEALILECCGHLKRLCSDMGNLIKLCHIDVSCVGQLEAMPLRIGKLTSLRTLQSFVVDKDKRSGLKELKDLKHLQGSLHISGLENVNDFVDAENANLNGKDGLKDLQLEWTCSSDGSNEKEIAAQVLEKLKPCQKLESLHIKGYHGTRFPQWLGHTYLSSLVSLTFEDCKNCAFFPSIGQLSSLKKLVIRNIDGIKSLGQEFYEHGYNSRAPFQSLEEFTIESLQEWKDWFPCGSSRNVEAFPRLQKLSIGKCSKLEGKLPEHLPLLQSLSIKNCDSLTCIARVLPPNLKRLVINHCSNLLTVLDEEEVSGSCMTTSCPENLKIEDCPSLTSLGSSSGNLPKALRYLSITQCSKLESIAKGFHDNAKLKKLYIGDCEKLETLPRGINNLISLKKLAIDKCPAMVSIPEGGFPTSLTFLVIRNANIYKSLLQWGLHRLMSLEFLGIGGCPDVISFPQEETGMILPSSLTILVIMDFPNLEHLSSIAQNLTCLEMLGLLSCPKLKYFPDVGLPQSLKQLQIKDCPLLEERCKEGEGVYWPIWLRYGRPTCLSHLMRLHLSGYHNSDSDFSDSSEPDD